ncbi:hypothetical protein BG004_003571 [Podila humilis]|nr:hypothetical protein BG004_003571 [Podila humilis]
MIAFYHWVDKTFYGPADTSSSLLTRTMAQVTQDDKPVPSEPSLSSSSSPSSAYPPGSFAEFFGWFRLPPRIFFDLSYAKGSTVFTEWAVLFFGSYLVMDITIGYCYYRERITFISGYFHHALHLYMCYMALSHEVATYLSHFMNVEIATAVLATGFLFPGRRNDKLFGLMFIICRILIDLPFTHEVVRNTSMTMPCKILTLIKIPMNFKLFANWVKQQQKLRKQSQDALRKAQQMKKE